MPLCTSDILFSWSLCGCAFLSVLLPQVAHLVCPIPTIDYLCLISSSCNLLKQSTLVIGLLAYFDMINYIECMDTSCSRLMVPMPAESYPLFCSSCTASNTIYSAFSSVVSTPIIPQHCILYCQLICNNPKPTDPSNNLLYIIQSDIIAFIPCIHQLYTIC